MHHVSMYAVIIRARPESLALAATLAPLVRGVVEGLVTSAVLVADSDGGDVADIADAAGCRILVAADWKEGFARAVALGCEGGVLVLDTGILLPQEFWPVLTEHRPLIVDRPAATRSARRRGLLHLMRKIRDWLIPDVSELGGIADTDRALLLPASLTRDIARKGADPFAYAFGKDLLRLDIKVKRIGPREEKHKISLFSNKN